MKPVIVWAAALMVLAACGPKAPKMPADAIVLRSPDLVQGAPVAGRVLRVLGGELGMGEEAERAHAVVEGNEDDVLRRPLLATYSIGDFAHWNPEAVCVDHKNGCVWVGEDCDSGNPSLLHKIQFTNL